MNTDRHKNRRKMAWWSFYLIAVVGVCILTLGLISDAINTRVVNLSFLLATIFGVWISIVLAYFGVTHGVDKSELDNGPKR